MNRIWVVPAKIICWHDADTFAAALDLGFAITYTARIRVDGVDAPELKTPAGKTALAWARTLVPDGTTATVHSQRWEKYGRVLATVVLPDGTDYASALLAAGHAVPYDGGKR